MSLRSLNKFLVGLSFLACTSAFATPFTFDVTGINSNDGFGAPINEVFAINVGANATIVSVSYNVNITAYGASWRSELALAYTDSGLNEGVLSRPGAGINSAGTGTYANTVDLVAAGLSFAVGADGILRLEFYENFNDVAGPDGIWNFGTFTFNTDAEDPTVPGGEVPEPASGLLMGAGLGLIGYTARRRRNASKSA